MSSGTRRSIATSSESLAAHEAMEVADIRERLARGELDMRAAQLELVEMVLARTAEFPRHMREDLRDKLLRVADTDPYFQLALEVHEVR